MTRHYFTHSFGLDAGGDTSNLPAEEDLSIVIEGLFFSALPQTGDSGFGVVTVKGLRGVSGAISEVDPGFSFARSATEVMNVSFPVRGKTSEGGAVTFSMGPSGSPVTGQVTVWGYYTDE